MGVIYSTDKYGVVENKAKALEYYKPLCDKGYDEAKTCNVVGAIYGVFGSSGKSDMYYKKACNAGNESSCEYLRKMEQIKGLYPY